MREILWPEEAKTVVVGCHEDRIVDGQTATTQWLPTGITLFDHGPLIGAGP